MTSDCRTLRWRLGCCVCVAAVAIVVAHVAGHANPIPPGGRDWPAPPPSAGFGTASLLPLLNWPIDVFVLWGAGRIIGIFGHGFDRRLLWWGTAVWVGGMGADLGAMYAFVGHRLLVVAAAVGAIFVWNAALALWPGRAGARGVVLAVAVALLTAPYVLIAGDVVPQNWW
jgi:hypothetical protein